jgi:hypothetical protein
MRREPGADREGERVARVLGPAGQLQGPVQHQGPPGRDLARREAGQDRKRGVNIAGVDRPGPGSEQVVLLSTEPHRPKHLIAPIVVPDLLEEVGVVVGVPGTPPLELAGLVEAFLAVLADRFQQPVAGLEAVFGGHHQRPRHQAGKQLEHCVSGSMPSPPQTVSAASRVQPPANTASRASSRCSGSASSW